MASAAPDDLKQDGHDRSQDEACKCDQERLAERRPKPRNPLGQVIRDRQEEIDHCGVAARFSTERSRMIKRQAERQVDQGRENIDERRLERVHDEIARGEHDLGSRNGSDERCVLDQLHCIVADRRQRDPPGLRRNDLTKHLPRREALSERGFPLADRDGLEAGAIDLAQSGRADQAQTQDGCSNRTQPNAEIGKAEIEDEEVREAGDVAIDLDERLERESSPTAPARGSGRSRGQIPAATQRRRLRRRCRLS